MSSHVIFQNKIFTLLMRKYRVKVCEGKSQMKKKTLIKCPLPRCRLYIPVLICHLHYFFHPSLRPLSPSSDVITLHHALISLFLPTFPPIFSLLITPSATFTCQRSVCVRACVCQREKAREGRFEEKKECR